MPSSPTQSHAAPQREATQIRIRGKNVVVPSMTIQDRTVICNGGWLRIAHIHDEAYVEGELLPDPSAFMSTLKRWAAKPDVFTFMQHIDKPEPHFSYPMEWDNYAVIPIVSYTDWLKNRARKDVRENLRRATREGVTVTACDFNDEFVAGIKRMYDDTPVRQGKPFWHHGKSLESLREVNGTYQQRAEYLGAYLGDELIGFLKMVYTRNIAKTMHVFSHDKHHRKRPTNALIAKAVEVCEQKGMTALIYGEYTFPGNVQNSLTEFKRNNGFEEVKYPRYYVPLSAKGYLAVKTGLHHELRTLIPRPVKRVLLGARSKTYQFFRSHRAANEPTASLDSNSGV